MSTRPLVVAHRGASHDLAEHSFEAQVRAIVEGADAIECDVRLTADRQLVCVHDARIDRTSNGHGPVSSMTLEQLRRWDFRAWKDGSPPDTTPPPESSVLTLDMLIDLARNAGRPVGLSIETKHPTRDSLLLEQHVLEALRRHGIPVDRPTDPQDPSAVRVMSFSQRALERMHALAPAIPTVYLTGAPTPAQLAGRRAGRSTVLGPWLEWVRVNADAVRRSREVGVEFHVWTVDSPADVQLCVDLDIGAVITNRPASTLRTLGRAVGGEH